MAEEPDLSLVEPEVLLNYTQRTVVDVKNPRWVREDHSLLNADVLFKEIEALGYIEFTTMENAHTAHGIQVWEECKALAYGPIGEYVAPIILPADISLAPNQFYSMLENMGKLSEFETAIKSVAPLSKKLTCNNQFLNSASFTWGMDLMTTVAPIVWGENWESVLSEHWISA